MPPVQIKFVASFSSQDPRHTVESLIKGSGSWLSHASDRTGRLQTDLQLECATTISFIDLGNSGSVMISIDVGRSSWPSNQPLVTLLPTVALMTPAEWRAGKNALAVRMFKQVDFNSEAAKEKWDRVRIICTQPFRKDAQFGLSLLRLHTNAELSPLRDTLTKAVQDPVINMTQSNSKKEELVSRMNLPAVKKKTMSQSLGWLEKKVLYAGDENTAGPPSNPLTSPVSRAARLVVMADKPISKSEAESHKSNLECECLDFLISLNLTVTNINTMKVSEVRKEFEKRRKNYLSHEEKIIFKDIALDYAKARLERLESQQQKADMKESKSNGIGKGNKNAISTKNCNKYVLNAEKPQSKFSFKSIKSPGNLMTTQQSLKSSRSISLEREKLRQRDDLGLSFSPGNSRNALALSDSRVYTPKRQRIGKSQKSSLDSRNATRPDPDGCISPRTKRKKEDSSAFTFSTFDITPSSDEDEIEYVGNQSKNVHSLSASRNTTGGFMVDPLLYTASRCQFSDNENNYDGKTLPCVSSKMNMVECPVCSGYFESSQIESHAASCAILVSSGSEPDTDDADSPTSKSEQDNFDECPICGDLIRNSVLQAHASVCASSAFG